VDKSALAVHSTAVETLENPGYAFEERSAELDIGG
jgi:hypothetical protein